MNSLSKTVAGMFSPEVKDFSKECKDFASKPFNLSNWRVLNNRLIDLKEKGLIYSNVYFSNLFSDDDICKTLVDNNYENIRESLLMQFFPTPKQDSLVCYIESSDDWYNVFFELFEENQDRFDPIVTLNFPRRRMHYQAYHDFFKDILQSEKRQDLIELAKKTRNKKLLDFIFTKVDISEIIDDDISLAVSYAKKHFDDLWKVEFDYYFEILRRVEEDEFLKEKFIQLSADFVQDQSIFLFYKSIRLMSWKNLNDDFIEKGRDFILQNYSSCCGFMDYELKSIFFKGEHLESFYYAEMSCFACCKSIEKLTEINQFFGKLGYFQKFNNNQEEVKD